VAQEVKWLFYKCKGKAKFKTPLSMPVVHTSNPSYSGEKDQEN
jgi:hypothetical protein